MLFGVGVWNLETTANLEHLLCNIMTADSLRMK